MPRRYADYGLQFADWNMVSVLVHLCTVQHRFYSYLMLFVPRYPAPVNDPQVWEGAEGLEWTVDTPAPYHTFEKLPEVK